MAELTQYSREGDSQESIPQVASALNTILIERSKVQQQRLLATVSELLAVNAQLLPLDAAAWQFVVEAQHQTDLELGDAMVYASIRSRLVTSPPANQALFATRDTDFREESVQKQLQQLRCDTVFDFAAATGRLGAG